MASSASPVGSSSLGSVRTLTALLADKAAMYKALSTPQHFMGQDEIKVNEATAKSQPAQPAPMQPMGSGGGT